MKLWLLTEHEKPRKRIIGIIPDLHAPFQNKKSY